MKKIRKFIFNRILGLFFLAICCFSFISLISRSEIDPPYSSTSPNSEIYNNLGLPGAYFSGYANELLGDISYFITIFFLIVGFKITIGIEVRFILIRLLILCLSIALSSWIAHDLINHDNILGDIISKIIFDQK